MKTYEIKNGKNSVTFANGKITIMGDWFSNYGIAYKRGVQRFGMDNSYGLTKRVVAWLTTRTDDWRAAKTSQ